MTIQRLNDCPVLVPYHVENRYGFSGVGEDCYYEKADLTYELICYPVLEYRALVNRKVAEYAKDEEEDYRKYVYQEYLKIPVSTKQLLGEWADSAGIYDGSPTLVEDIQRAVQNAAVYNLYGKDYPAGVDVAEYFLTEAKEGVCQHFATAATILLLALTVLGASFQMLVKEYLTETTVSSSTSAPRFMACSVSLSANSAPLIWMVPGMFSTLGE